MQLTTNTIKTAFPSFRQHPPKADLMVPAKVRTSMAASADPVELRMSVASIKRVDPYVKDILAKSTHVALYRFNPPQNEWEKTDTEGALFLYSRSGEPYHSIMIMNRLNTSNLIEPIVKEFEYQLQAPFLLYRNNKNKIFGIWFYNREECVNITIILESLMDGLKDKNRSNSNDINKSFDNKDTMDILGMLTRAQEDYNKTPVKTDDQDMQHRFSSTPRAPPDVTSQSVMDFFAKAGVKSSNASAPVTVVQPTTVVQTPEGNILQRLMSNPAHSVEHIEKQQRSVTPKTLADQKGLPLLTSNNTQNDNGFNFIRLQSPTQSNLASSSPLAQFLKQTPSLSSSIPMREASPLALLLETPQKQPLMPPMMFATSSSKERDFDTREIEPLTKNQLLQAMNYLLQNDSEFVTKLHEAYVKSLTEKMAPMRHCGSSNTASLI